MNEEVNVKFGGDTSALSAAMRGIDKTVQHHSKEWSKHLSEGFSKLGGFLTIAGAYEGLRKVGEAIKQIKSAAEVGGVSTAFFQDLANVGSTTGVSSEQVGKLLNKLQQVLPIGSDVADEFNKISDAMAATNDPIEKMNIAVATFGAKLGPVMVDIAGQGSDAIKNLAAQFSKFSEEDIKNIEDANLQIEKIGNVLLVATGKVISFIGFLGKAAGALSVMFDGKKLAAALFSGLKQGSFGAAVGLFKEVQDELADAMAAVMVQSDEELKKVEEAKELAKAINKEKANQAAADKHDANAAKALAHLVKEAAKSKINAAKESLALAEKELDVMRKQKETRDEFGKLSLSELADRGNPNATAAQDLKARIQDAEAAGNHELSAQLKEQYRQTVSGISGLSSSEANPFAQDPFDKSMTEAQNLANTSTGRTGWADYQDREKGRRRVNELNNIGRDAFDADAMKQQAGHVSDIKTAVEKLANVIQGDAMVVDMKDVD